jgi:hypothetical protein
MSKQHLAGLVLRPGQAQPASNRETNVPSNQPSKEGAKEAREEIVREVSMPAVKRRPWDGLDEPVKGNFEVNTRLLAKLAWLKSAKQIRTQKDFVAEVLEREADKLIAKAEKEGY